MEESSRMIQNRIFNALGFAWRRRGNQTNYTKTYRHSLFALAVLRYYTTLILVLMGFVVLLRPGSGGVGFITEVFPWATANVQSYFYLVMAGFAFQEHKELWKYPLVFTGILAYGVLSVTLLLFDPALNGRASLVIIPYLAGTFGGSLALMLITARIALLSEVVRSILEGTDDNSHTP
jgi:hypothetical protein